MACQPVETFSSPPSSFSETSRSASITGNSDGLLMTPAVELPST